MSKARNDRNIIKIGTTKKDDKEWDRIEDRLQTDPNLGGGGPPELIVPGTYVPKVGLPPGIPYVYVIGNLIEGYPVDISSIGPLDPYTRWSLDLENYFGLGIDTIIGKATDGSVRAYNVPAAPISIAGQPPTLGKVISTDGTLFEIPASSYLIYGYLRGYLRVREPDLSWTEYEVYNDFGYSAMGYGEGSDVSGVVFVTTPTFTGSAGTYNLYSYDVVSIDKTGTVTNTQPASFVVNTTGGVDGYPGAAVIENGWIVLLDGGTFTLGTLWARPSIVTEAATTVRLGNILPQSAGVTVDGISVGSTGIIWVAYNFLIYGSSTQRINGVVRFDAITGQSQRYESILFDSTGTYDVRISKTLYVRDNVCAVAGNYNNGLGDVPTIVFVALDENGALTLNMLEFPDYIGYGSSITNIIKLSDGTIVFQLYSGQLAATGQPVNILFAITEYP